MRRQRSSNNKRRLKSSPVAVRDAASRVMPRRPSRHRTMAGALSAMRRHRDRVVRPTFLALARVWTGRLMANWAADHRACSIAATSATTSAACRLRLTCSTCLRVRAIRRSHIAGSCSCSHGPSRWTTATLPRRPASRRMRTLSVRSVTMSRSTSRSAISTRGFNRSKRWRPSTVHRLWTRSSQVCSTRNRTASMRPATCCRPWPSARCWMSRC